jgi:2-polyprenyl-6-methoxyphenol hydroxylase-like FAD-dependent oxidoreductase
MYDVIVVGARCAGAPTAMLLARRGYRVLMLDKSTFPSDAVSTHYLHLPGVVKLRNWGLLDRVLASGCPKIHQITLSISGIVLSGMSPEWDGIRYGIAPRRTVLDEILFDGAVEAGVEAHTGFRVEEILVTDGRVTGVRGHERDGSSLVATAPLVVGADGIHSLVAKTVQPEEYLSTPPGTAVWYTYWAGTDFTDQVFARVDGHEVFVVPTNDGCVNVLAGVKHREFQNFRKDVEGNYHKTLDLFPELADRIRAGRQVEPFYGTRYTRQWMRHPYGPGWVLIGDSGYHKDPVAGIGIADAFRQVDVLVDAIDDGLAGRRDITEAFADYHAWRDETFRDYFEYICRMATLDEYPAEILKVLEALKYDEPQRTQFFGTIGAYVRQKDFFSPENCARILAGPVGSGLT